MGGYKPVNKSLIFGRCSRYFFRQVGSTSLNIAGRLGCGAQYRISLTLSPASTHEIVQTLLEKNVSKPKFVTFVSKSLLLIYLYFAGWRTVGKLIY